MRLTQIYFLAIFLLAGCHKYGVSVKEEQMGRESLASTYVGSPDPRQAHPPTGGRLIVYWRGPPEWMDQQHRLHVELINRDYEKKSYIYPLEKKQGRMVLEEGQGLLTYRAWIEAPDGREVALFQQQLWFELIREEDV